MIESIRIENFKCFESFQVDGLRRITLIGGENNAGKTALLDALFLFVGDKDARGVFGPYARRGLETLDHRSETAWGPIFYNFELDRSVRMAVKCDGKEYTLSVRLKRDFSPPIHAIDSTNESGRISTDMSRLPTDALEFTDNEGNATYSYLDPKHGPVPGGRRHFGLTPPIGYIGSKSRLARESAAILGELERRREIDPVIEFVRLIARDLEDLSLIPLADEPIIHGSFSNMPVQIPIALVGGGVARLLDVVLGMKATATGVLLVDEIENGIHWSVQSQVFGAIAKAATELPCQVFATTHSYEFLRHAHEALVDGPYMDDFRYIRLDRAQEGIVPRVYDIEMLGIAIRTGMEVR